MTKETINIKESRLKKFWHNKGKAMAKNLLFNHNYILSLMLLLILGRIASPNFLSSANLIGLIKSSTFIGIIALGMTLVIISGNIDLSVGSILALVAANTALTFNATHSILLSLLFAILLGGLLGFFNGIFIGKAKVASFIVTLATLTAFRSLTIQQGSGGPILIDQEEYFSILRNIGYGKFLDIPYLVFFFVFIAFGVWVLMTKTKFGRYVYAVGSNETAARLSGINVDRVKIWVFTITGILTGISAFLYVTRFGSVDTSTAGKGFELDAIAAVAIGGTSMAGGRGFVQGTFFGIIILYAIDAILTAFKVPAFVNDLIKGILILGAVLLQKALDRNKKSE